MNFNEFWNELSKQLLIQHTWRTLTQYQPFNVRLGNSVIIITKISGHTSNVSRNYFERYWNVARNFSREERYKNKDKRYYEFGTSAYLGSLMKHILADREPE